MTISETKPIIHEIDKIRTGKGRWVFVAPLSNLQLTQAINFEFRIDKITLVQGNKLLRRRKRFNLPKSLFVKDKHSWMRDWFSGTDAVAIVYRDGTLADFELEVLEEIRTEIAILALSQLGWVGKRDRRSFPSLADEHLRGVRRYSVSNAKDGSGITTQQIIGSPMPLEMDGGWKHFQRKFFFPLIKIIRGNSSVETLWKKDIRNAAILAGQSQQTTDWPQAFLWNMIAIEMLLTEQGDKVSDMLPERVEAFIGWVQAWRTDRFNDRLQDAYTKRCLLVHQGQRNSITLEDVHFTDLILLNLFLNICRHPKLFSTKKALIHFSKHVQAEKLLDLKSRVQPATLSFLRNRSAT